MGGRGAHSKSKCTWRIRQRRPPAGGGGRSSKYADASSRRSCRRSSKDAAASCWRSKEAAASSRRSSANASAQDKTASSKASKVRRAFCNTFEGAGFLQLCPLLLLCQLQRLVLLYHSLESGHVALHCLHCQGGVCVRACP